MWYFDCTLWIVRSGRTKGHPKSFPCRSTTLTPWPLGSSLAEKPKTPPSRRPRFDVRSFRSLNRIPGVFLTSALCSAGAPLSLCFPQTGLISSRHPFLPLLSKKKLKETMKEKDNLAEMMVTMKSAFRNSHSISRRSC